MVLNLKKKIRNIFVCLHSVWEERCFSYAHRGVSGSLQIKLTNDINQRKGTEWPVHPGHQAASIIANVPQNCHWVEYLLDLLSQGSFYIIRQTQLSFLLGSKHMNLSLHGSRDRRHVLRSSKGRKHIWLTDGWLFSASNSQTRRGENLCLN